MEQIKCQSNNSLDNYNVCKRRKIQSKYINFSFALIIAYFSFLVSTNETNFEDLSNELIYDIFEFLDYFHVYEACFDLNLRFHSLITNSNLPIKINLSSISKSAFKRYNKDIIETSMHRIN
jgi:GH35 family endo-1,4-beta-xylanase